MSGIFGIFNRNGKPVDRKIVDTMLGAMSYWKPDEHGTWIDGSVSLGHTMLWNTAESKYEHLPVRNETYVLTMDARIDNRNELLNELDLPDRPISEIGDSEFILAAYQKWGEDCPKYLLGDFAFVIWDEKKKQLFCARDHIGIKQFYYYLSNDLFIFSNDIEGVLAHPSVPKNYDDDIVATFLKDDGVHAERKTFFEKIKKLPAATTLTVSKLNITENIYWNIENVPLIHYDSYQKYVDKLKELFDSAVEYRLRTVFPVASHLSGGIDSSPIAVLAARKLKKKKEKLYVFNWINVPEGNDLYEYEAWNFSRRVAEIEQNIIHKEFNIDLEFMIKQYENHNILTKGTMFYWEEYYVQEAINDMGVRTLLSGWGGDELISYNGYSYISGLFSQGRIIEAFKYLFKEKKYLEYTWSKFFKRTLKVILPSKIINQLNWKSQNLQDESNSYSLYTTDRFTKYIEAHKNKEYPHVVGVRKNQHVMYKYGHLQNRIESWNLSAFSRKMEYRYPLLDKRIVEFAIGIPEEMFFPEKGKCRHLFKNAVSDLLPYDIVWFSKPDEIKINKTLKEKYTKALVLMQKEYRNRDHNFSENKYVEYRKIKESFNSFNFDRSDSLELGNIIVAIMLLHSMDNFSYNEKKSFSNFEDNDNEKAME